MATKYRDRPRTRTLLPFLSRPTVAPTLPEITLQPEPPARDHSAREDVIRTRAYFLWEQAGRPECDGSYFWCEAERQMGSGG